MFPSLTRRLGTRLVDGLDLILELSTLGEFGVDREGVFALQAATAAERVPSAVGRLRDGCPPGARLSRIRHGAAARP